MSVIFGPYEIERGEILPATREYKSPQKVTVADDGSPHVAESGYDEEYLNATLIDDSGQIENVIYYIRNGVRYSAVAFYVTDGFGVQRQVRFWASRFKPKIVAGSLWELKVKLRVEV